ncbi:MAG: hypothetical protein HC890_16050 [Chloroflexaceae bacterium]|nr:hypothetical protein [Chloroflexaceae bacterium]
MKANPLPLILSLATAPFLLGLLALESLLQAANDLGDSSEEIFRGDRLPVLHIPTPPRQSAQTD